MCQCVVPPPPHYAPGREGKGRQDGRAELRPRRTHHILTLSSVLIFVARRNEDAGN